MSQATKLLPPTHPLEPFTAEELSTAVGLVRNSGRISKDADIITALPIEPSKKELAAFRKEDPFERELRILGYDRDGEGSFEARISLSRNAVVELRKIEDGQAPLGLTDLVEAMGIVQSDPGWQDAMRKRGVEDFSLAQIDPWPAGGFPPPEIPEGHRMTRAITFVRESPNDNAYARPVEGLIAYVDLDEKRVARLDDHGVVPLPPESANYDPESAGSPRQGLRALEITQPNGPSFSVEGHAIHWQNWHLRISLHPIEGLVLHQVGYEDQGRIRPILHRAALSDMVVPYGDDSPMHDWKHVFDASEMLLGRFVNSLKLGCDCLGEIYYFDATILNWNGTPQTVENAICMHEEDYGILWKHTNLATGQVEVRRSRRLVISSFHTIGNYDYGFFWYLYLDGTIQMEVKLTGIVGVSSSPQGSDTAPLIAPHLASPNHQHLFCYRLDFAIDGEHNSVYEVNAIPDPPGPENPRGGIFRSVATPLLREKDSQRRVNSASSRYWKVVNPNVKNRLGQPVGYKLLPQGTPTLLAHPDSNQAKRAGFATNNFCATRHDPNELTAAGEFSNLHPGGAGLSAYVANNRSLENEDIVVWHTFGLTHVPRPEDWPVMPVEYCGFSLAPVGFFDRNPALDLPRSSTCKS